MLCGTFVVLPFSNQMSNSLKNCIYYIAGIQSTIQFDEKRQKIIKRIKRNRTNGFMSEMRKYNFQFVVVRFLLPDLIPQLIKRPIDKQSLSVETNHHQQQQQFLSRRDINKNSIITLIQSRISLLLLRLFFYLLSESVCFSNVGRRVNVRKCDARKVEKDQREQTKFL